MNKTILEKELERALINLKDVNSNKLKAQSIVMLLEKLDVVTFPKSNLIKPTVDSVSERNDH